MGAEQLAAFLGGAAAFAALAGLAVLGGLALVRGRRAWRAWPLVVLTLFFLALTQHPFPDRAAMTCPFPHTQPRLVPFGFVAAAWARWAEGLPARAWLTDVTVMAAAMNLLLCAAIGAALARHATGWRTALLFGAALSLGVELTQVTGAWGLYPCAWRQFDVDDLILNVLGVVAGFWAGRRVGFRPPG